MTLIINPGSHIAPAREDSAWTNTYEKARETAEYWLKLAQDDGVDVELLPGSDGEKDGRWKFWMRHRLTGVVVAFETHGIHPREEYTKQYIFEPRQYWNGSSSGGPEHEDFLKAGFKVETRIIPARE